MCQNLRDKQIFSRFLKGGGKWMDSGDISSVSLTWLSKTIRCIIKQVLCEQKNC